MKVKAKLNNLRIAPRKVRLVVDLIRGLDVDTARSQLRFLPKKSAGAILKLLNSATANAKHNFKLDPTSLYISEIFAGEGVTLKRIMPRAMGRAAHIRKRSSHVTLILADKNDQADSKKGEKAGKAEVLKKTKIVKEKLEEIEKIEDKEEKSAGKAWEKMSEAKPASANLSAAALAKEEGFGEAKPASAESYGEAKEKKSETKAHKGVKRIAGIAKRTFKEHNHK